MKEIEFYVGIDTKDIQQFKDFVKGKDFIKIKSSFDDLHGYYEFTIVGLWDAYKAFIDQPFVKSLNHYEE